MIKYSFNFNGRGAGSRKGSDTHGCWTIECAPGTVLVVLIRAGGVEFVHAYCRKAEIGRWELHCEDLFRRASSPDLTRSWAEPLRRKRLFRGARLEIEQEQEWMRDVRQ
jgi:hypothetical protein